MDPHSVYISQIELHQGADIQKITHCSRSILRQNKIRIKFDTAYKQISRLIARRNETGTFRPQFDGKRPSKQRVLDVQDAVQYYREHCHEPDCLEVMAQRAQITKGGRSWFRFIKEIRQQNDQNAAQNNTASSTDTELESDSSEDFEYDDIEQPTPTPNPHSEPQNITTDCYLCNGPHKMWVTPTMKCSKCHHHAHPYCEPTYRYFLRDPTQNVDFTDVHSLRSNMTHTLQSKLVCSACCHSKITDIHRDCIQPNNDIVRSIAVDFNQNQKMISITENHSDGHTLSKQYQMRKLTDKVKVKAVHITKWNIDQNKLKQSLTEYQKLSGDKTDPETLNPTAFSYDFVDSDVPSGTHTIAGGFTSREKAFIKKRTAFMHKSRKELPRFMKRRRNVTDWAYTEKRLKAYFQFWYKYNKNGNNVKSIELRRNKIKIEDLPIFKFITLRMQALWPGMFEPNMKQMNRYHGWKGITQHADEIEWFPEPIHSLRVGGYAMLHFGMRQQGGFWENHRDLFVPILDGNLFRMSGIFQLLFKHGIPCGNEWIAPSTLTILSRKANTAAVNVTFSKNQR